MIVDPGIERTHFYDHTIRQKTGDGRSGEALFFELALEDLTAAAVLLRPDHDATEGRDTGGCRWKCHRCW